MIITCRLMYEYREAQLQSMFHHSGN